ncbi:pectate lyase [Asticcacaulis machinosus]|uniref:Pectate lyase n=1 Tax=Asticcacaulis machinosus TaxID=2984211 RepID=A0ABT5HK22_9CAUL|nr:pectate lyase [Asticcacaulis machinosus]MDC7676594.1 pectate lyase [Asticcacaulis machinosus]
MKRFGAICLGLVLLTAPTAYAYEAVRLDSFSDAVHHWQNRHGKDYARYSDDQIVEIADNILLYQRHNGGWIENQDPARKLDPQEIAAITTQKSDSRASFDNRNIYAQIEYLMAVYDQTKSETYRAAAMKGLEFTLSQQMPVCGGWPHTLPPSTDYHHKLTIADEVTSGNLRMLRKISLKQAPFTSINEATRQTTDAALKRGDDCVLKLQIRQNGKLTGWAGQYDPVNLAPSKGRTFELPAIVSQETVAMLDYLMSIDHPTPQQIAAIEGAVSWLKRSQIKGYALKTIPLDPPVKYDYHTATFDRELVADNKAPPLWARFYDLNDNSVVLANRDEVRVKAYADIHPERRSGYSWYGDWPQRLIAVEYPAWKARHSVK